MTRFLVTGNSFTEAIVGDEVVEQCEVVISTYEVSTEEEAITRAVEEYPGIESAQLNAYQIN